MKTLIFFINMFRHFKFRISLLYIIIGCTWILTTDRLAFYFFKDPKIIEQVSNYKGWLYVILTGLLIFILTGREEIRRNKIEKELIKAKQKAEENDNLKSAFLANMSHEIRTPMNAIMGFTELLEDPDYSQEKKQLFLKIIRQRSKDLLNIINDILDISKLNAGQIKLNITEGDLSVIIEEISEFFNLRNTIEKKDISFNINYGLNDNESKISADFGRLKQILINILSNACKYTDEGTIEVGCNLTKENTILFYVKDTGIGIPKENLEEIFERFYQIRAVNIRKNISGTGLGLSISKGLVDLMHGSIWVESEENIGSTFYIVIPYVPIIGKA